MAQGAKIALVAGFYEAITKLGLTCYSTPPQLKDGGSDQDYPRVDIGALVMSPWDTFDAIGFDFTIRLHTRARGTSQAPVLAIQDTLYARLHRGDLVLDGWRLILMDRQLSDVTRLDGSFDGVCEYHGLIEQNLEQE